MSISLYTGKLYKFICLRFVEENQGNTENKMNFLGSYSRNHSWDAWSSCHDNLCALEFVSNRASSLALLAPCYSSTLAPSSLSQHQNNFTPQNSIDKNILVPTFLQSQVSQDGFQFYVFQPFERFFCPLFKSCWWCLTTVVWRLYLCWWWRLCIWQRWLSCFYATTIPINIVHRVRASADAIANILWEQRRGSSGEEPSTRSTSGVMGRRLDGTNFWRSAASFVAFVDTIENIIYVAATKINESMSLLIHYQLTTSHYQLTTKSLQLTTTHYQITTK